MQFRQNSHSFNISPSKMLSINKRKSPFKAHKQQQFLKTSQNFNHKYHKSIESIHLNRSNNYDYAQYKQRCPLDILKQSKHLNIDRQMSEHKMNKEKIKQKAYKWFNDKKTKINQTQKLERYLLPKIMRLNKDSKQYALNRNVDTIDNSINPKNSIKKIRASYSKNVIKKSDSIYEQVSIFKQKCNKEMDNVELPLPLKAKQREYFFDVSLNQVIKQKQNANFDIDRSVQVQTKFKALYIEKQNPLKQQEFAKVPKFLVQRLTIEPSLGEVSLPKHSVRGKGSPLSKYDNKTSNKKYYQHLR